MKCNLKKQIKLGMKIEAEHTPDIALRRKIALDHIREYPCYYEALKKMEAKLKRKK